MRNAVDFLFVCTANMLRSPTCEHVARMLDYSADSAGTATDVAIRPLRKDAIMRARKVICMTEFHAKRVRALYSDADIDVWEIADIYEYCAPELIAIVREHLEKYPRPPGLMGAW